MGSEASELAGANGIMIIGAEHRIRGIDGAPTHEEKKAGPPIGPGTPFWRARRLAADFVSSKSAPCGTDNGRDSRSNYEVVNTTRISFAT